MPEVMRFEDYSDYVWHIEHRAYKCFAREHAVKVKINYLLWAEQAFNRAVEHLEMWEKYRDQYGDDSHLCMEYADMLRTSVRAFCNHTRMCDHFAREEIRLERQEKARRI